MFDLETGGLPNTNGYKDDIVLLSIGAVIFDPNNITKDFPAGFYKNIDPKSCEELGMVWDPQTAQWWREQQQEAWETLQEDQINIKVALQEFIKWIRTFPVRVTAYWANSPSFDKILLERAMITCGLQWPRELPFYAERDLRTLKAEVYPNNDAPNFNRLIEGPAHNSMVDAARQALLVQHCKAVIHNHSMVTSYPKALT